jgi:purine-binding chemotaxis protein CheW
METDIAILKARAKALATERVERIGETLGLELLVFALGGERHALALDRISEVTPFKQIDHLPGTPSHISGVIPLHGRIVALVDLNVLFGLKGQSNSGYAIVLRSAEMEFAVGADEIIGVSWFEESRIVQAPETIEGRKRDFIRGIAPGPILVLDGAAMLGDASLIVDQG